NKAFEAQNTNNQATLYKSPLLQPYIKLHLPLLSYSSHRRVSFTGFHPNNSKLLSTHRKQPKKEKRKNILKGLRGTKKKKRKAENNAYTPHATMQLSLSIISQKST